MRIKSLSALVLALHLVTNPAQASVSGDFERVKTEAVKRIAEVNPRVVALGENMHFIGDYQKMKLAIAKDLILHQNFRVLSIENRSPEFGLWLTHQWVKKAIPCTRENFDDYARSGANFVSRDREMQKLFQFICRWNGDHPNDPVILSGSDTFSGVNEEALNAIPFLIEEPKTFPYLGDSRFATDYADAKKTCWWNFPDMQEPTLPPVEVQKAKAKKCIRFVGGLRKKYSGRAEEIYLIALYYKNLYFLNAPLTPNAGSADEIHRNNTWADQFMAQYRHPFFRGKKWLFFPPNSHMARAISPDAAKVHRSLGMREVGNTLGHHLGRDYFAIGFSARRASQPNHPFYKEGYGGGYDLTKDSDWIESSLDFSRQKIQFVPDFEALQTRFAGKSLLYIGHFFEKGGRIYKKAFRFPIPAPIFDAFIFFENAEGMVFSPKLDPTKQQ